MQITYHIKPCKGITSLPETLEIPMNLQPLVRWYAGKFSDLHPDVQYFINERSNRPWDINTKDYFYSYEVV